MLETMSSESENASSISHFPSVYLLLLSFENADIVPSLLKKHSFALRTIEFAEFQTAVNFINTADYVLNKMYFFPYNYPSCGANKTE